MEERKALQGRDQHVRRHGGSSWKPAKPLFQGTDFSDVKTRGTFLLNLHLPRLCLLSVFADSSEAVSTQGQTLAWSGLSQCILRPAPVGKFWGKYGP